MENCIKILNFDNLLYNINYIKNLLPSTVKFCAVVKCDAYGHSARAICQELLDKVDYFAFSNNNEAIEIKRHFPNANCLIIGPFSSFKLKTAIKQGVIVSIENIEQLSLLNKIARKLNITAPFHIKIDTGLHRLGIESESNILEFLNSLQHYKNCKLVGIFSHLGSGESKECTRTKQQADTFLELTGNMPKQVIKHLANSINTFTHPQYSFDMVRVGLAIYGYGNPKLKPVMQVKAKIVAIKNVRKGEKIGYGDEHIARKDLVSATIAIGYGQGLPRAYAKSGYVLINGYMAKIIANICMDMTIVDITHIPNVMLGDYATIVSTETKPNADSIAKICKTIPYEILTNFRNVPLKSFNKINN